MKPYRRNERQHAGLGLGTMILITMAIWGLMWLCSAAYEYGITHLAN